jgi:hypothetical protein
LRIEDVDQAGTVAQWLGVEMFFRMLDSKTTRRLVGRAGFKLVKSSVEERQKTGTTSLTSAVLPRNPQTTQLSRAA